jgi:hypothetical protein
VPSSDDKLDEEEKDAGLKQTEALEMLREVSMLSIH